MTTAIDELLLSAAEVGIQAASGNPSSATIVAYTGGLMAVPGWGPVVLDLAGIDASAEQVGILADHDATLKGIVGHGQAEIVEGKLLVRGTITPSTDAARQVIDLAKAGFRFQASVGVAPVEFERVRGGDVAQVNGRALQAPRAGFTLVKASVLKEVSIVVIGADANTSVAIAANGKEKSMSSENNTLTAEQVRADALAETHRINAIRKACGGRFGDIEARAIAEGWDANRAELEVLRASRPSVSVIHGRYVPATRTVLEAAILAHMGCESLAEKHLGEQAAQKARDLRAKSLVDLCQAALHIEGKDAPHSREAMIRAALSTYSLPVALGNAANKLLLEAYQESPATWRSFAAIKPANDFKEHVGIRPTDTGELTLLADPTFEGIDDLPTVLADLKRKRDTLQGKLESVEAASPPPLTPQQLRDWANEQFDKLERMADKEEVDLADRQLVEAFVQRIDIDPDARTGVVVLHADLHSVLASTRVLGGDAMRAVEPGRGLGHGRETPAASTGTRGKRGICHTRIATS